MSSRFLVFLALLFLAASVHAGDDETQDRDAPFVSGTLLVRFKAGYTNQDVDAFYKLHKLAERTNFDIVPSADGPGLKLVGVPVEQTKVLVRKLQDDPRVQYVEYNYLLFADLTPNDPDFTDLWGMHNTGQSGGTADADIDAPEAWDINTGSSDVIVAVIDTGVDYTHPDLAANMWTNPDEIAGNSIDDDGNGYVDDIHGINAITDTGDPQDDNGHGTHTAGTLGARGDNSTGVVGVNWQVTIIGCKFLGAAGTGSTADAIKCFEYVNHLKNVQGQNIIVTNNSWGGGPFSQSLKDAMEGLDQPGMEPILHACAAGNAGLDTDVFPHYPSSYDLDNIIAVASTDDDDLYAGDSSYGAVAVDLAAPGVNIFSTYEAGTYATLSGTSMATPHVAGAAALIRAQFPTLSATDLKERIKQSVDPIGSLGSNSTKPTLTNGRLNVFAALGDDTTPPSDVTDLTATAGAGLGEVLLAWTAQGDDGATGTAASYDVRYSASPLTEGNWDAAHQAVGEPAPQASGASESFTVTGVPPGTMYFGVKVVDDVGNQSGLSNTPSTTASGVVVFADDMEAGAGTWTAAGSGLWHQSTNRAQSPTTSWYYGQEGLFNYDTGAQNDGTLTSAALDLSAATDALLVFHEWSEVESDPGFDRTRVQASSDSVTWTTIFESHGTSAAWMKRAVDLSAYAGGTLYLRFWFDTIDASSNDFEGWYVDDVTVVADAAGGPPSETVLASDDFESGGFSGGTGWLDSWATSSDIRARDQDGPYAGAFHMQMATAGTMERSVNLAGQTGVRLRFWAKLNAGWESDDLAEARVSPDGVNWTVVRTFTSAESDDTYYFYDLDLAAFAMTSQFFVAFAAVTDGRQDYWFVDDVELVSTGPPTAPPVAEAGADAAGDEGETLSFDGSGSTNGDGTITTWEWDFGDGNTATGVNVTHAYADNGTYTVTLTVTDDLGASGTDTATATVANLPPTAEAGGPYAGTAGVSIAFSGSATDPGADDTHTYSWDFGDGGSATGASVSYTYAAEGDYTATLTVTDDDGDSHVDTAAVSVAPGSGLPTTLASDDFESGDFTGGTGAWVGNWTTSGDLGMRTNKNGPYSGSSHVGLRSNTGLLERSVDLTGATGVSLKFWAKVSQFEAGDEAHVQVSSDGVTYTTVKTLTSADSDDTYREHEIDISGFAMTADFRIRFSAAMSDRNDHWFVDDVELTGNG